MEGGENKKIENTKEKTRGRERTCRLWGGGWLTYGSGLNYKFAPKISYV